MPRASSRQRLAPAANAAGPNSARPTAQSAARSSYWRVGSVSASSSGRGPARWPPRGERVRSGSYASPERLIQTKVAETKPRSPAANNIVSHVITGGTSNRRIKLVSIRSASRAFVTANEYAIAGGNFGIRGFAFTAPCPPPSNKCLARKASHYRKIEALQDKRPSHQRHTREPSPVSSRTSCQGGFHRRSELIDRRRHHQHDMKATRLQFLQQAR